MKAVSQRLHLPLLQIAKQPLALQVVQLALVPWEKIVWDAIIYSYTIAKSLSTRKLIPQYVAKCQLEFVCMYIYVSVGMRACHA